MSQAEGAHTGQEQVHGPGCNRCKASIYRKYPWEAGTVLRIASTNNSSKFLPREAHHFTASCKHRWKDLMFVNETTSEGSMFDIVTNPKSDLLNASVWPPICMASRNCHSWRLVNPRVLLGADGRAERTKRSHTGRGARPHAIL